MLRKTLSITAAAALTLAGVVAAPLEAMAHGPSSSGHSSGHSVSHSSSHITSHAPHMHTNKVVTHNYVSKNVNKQVVHTKTLKSVKSGKHPHGNGHHYSHHRHHWHGVWWAYGVGSCWVWDDYYGEYYWVCGDDD